MSKFVLDCDTLSAISSDFKNQGSQMDEVGSAIGGYDTSDAEEFNFGGAVACISDNVHAAAQKMNNTSTLIETVIGAHTSLQSSIAFDPSVSYSQAPVTQTAAEIAATATAERTVSPITANVTNQASKSDSNAIKQDAQSASYVKHTVTSKDTLAKLAATYGTSVSAIAAANNIKDVNMIYDDDVLIIPTNAEEIPAESSNEENNRDAQNVIDIPEGLGKYKTYMGWQTITNEDTAQGALKRAAGMNFDEEGFGKIGDRYVVACTNTFGKIGDYVDFQQADGSVIHAIIGDEKSQVVTPWDSNPANKWGHDNGQSIVEFVVDKNSWYNCGHENPGTSSCHPEWGQTVVKAINYGNYFD